MGHLVLVGLPFALLFYVFISILDSLQIIGDYIIDKLYEKYSKD